jgi:hypothetical protein
MAVPKETRTSLGKPLPAFLIGKPIIEAHEF